MRFKVLSLLPGLAVAIGMVALPSGSASASTTTTTTLPLTSFHQVVADSAHGHLFFSEGSANYTTGGANAILVTDLDGNPVTTITGLSGVKGLALSPDGSTLYAALSGTDQISAISTSTLKQVSTYPTSTDTPYNLTFEDGLLWITYEATVGQSSVGYINPAAASPTFVPQALPATWYFPPSISGDPDNASAASTTGTLVASSPGQTPTQVNSFQISGATVTSSASASWGGSYSPQYGLDVLPGGSQFVMDGSTYSTTSLNPTPESTYPVSDDGDSAAAVAPNGTVAIGYGTNSSTAKAGIVVFPSGSTTADPAGGYPGLGDTTSYVAGLDWSADSSELFAVITQDDSSGNVTGYTLQTLYPPTPLPRPLPLSLSTSAGTVGYQGKVTITAALGITDDSASHTVYIYETPAGGQKKVLTTITLGSGVATSITTGPLTTSTSFTASVDGDSEYSATTTPAKTVSVDAQVQEAISGYYGSETLSELYRLYHHTGTLRVNTTVAPNKAGECVKFEFQHNNGTAWVPLTTTGCATLSSTSKFAITRAMSAYSVGGKYRIRVDYIPSSKDTANLAADSGWLYFIDEK